MRRDAVSVRIGAHHRAWSANRRCASSLLQGIARGEKMDLILQKATELGVTRFVPLKMSRSTVRLDEQAARKRQQHWQAVVVSACEQSGRNTVPRVADPQPFQQCLRPQAAGLRLLLAPGDGSDVAGRAACRCRGAGQAPERIELLVGPEGGFDPEETLGRPGRGLPGLPARTPGAAHRNRGPRGPGGLANAGRRPQITIP